MRQDRNEGVNMDKSTISTRQVLLALWRKKWVVLVCVVVCVALAVGLAALLVPPRYEASSVFLLKGPEPEVLVESGIYILQTRESLDAILEEAGNVCSREELAGMLDARILGTTPLLEVTVSGPDAVIAKTLADAVTAVLPQRMAQLMAGVEVEIADAPELPANAEGPDFVLFALLGLLVGVALPVGWITAREYWKVTA